MGKSYQMVAFHLGRLPGGTKSFGINSVSCNAQSHDPFGNSKGSSRLGFVAPCGFQRIYNEIPLYVLQHSPKSSDVLRPAG